MLQTVPILAATAYSSCTPLLPLVSSALPPVRQQVYRLRCAAAADAYAADADADAALQASHKQDGAASLAAKLHCTLGVQDSW